MLLNGVQLGRYTIVQRIGGGGMGDVYLAEDPQIGQQVAIKVMKTEATLTVNTNTMKVMKEFQDEARAIAKLDHPHILPMLSYGEAQVHGDTIAYIVMPYRKDGNLVQWFLQPPKKELQLIDYGHLIQQAASALQYAHDHNTLHRDVKPQNFLVRDNPTTPHQPDLLLSDFGLAKLMNPASSVSMKLRGTPAYMAPEQWQGEAVAASDQYALAVMAYELLAGQTPFLGNPMQMMNCHLNIVPPAPSSFNPALSQSIDAVLLRALQKDPTQRFVSINAFGDNLMQTLAGMAHNASGWSTANNYQLGAANNVAHPHAGSPPSGPTPYHSDASYNAPTYLNQAYPYPNPRRSSNQKTLIIVLSVLVVALAIGASILGVNALAHPGTNSANQPTPIAQITPANTPTPTPMPTPTPTPTPAPVPTPTPTLTAIWNSTFNGATTSTQYNTYRTNKGFYFVIVNLTFQNLSPQIQILKGSMLVLKDSAGNSFAEDPVANKSPAYRVNPNEILPAQFVFNTPNSACIFTLLFNDPMGKIITHVFQTLSPSCRT